MLGLPQKRVRRPAFFDTLSARWRRWLANGHASVRGGVVVTKASQHDVL